MPGPASNRYTAPGSPGFALHRDALRRTSPCGRATTAVANARVRRGVVKTDLAIVGGGPAGLAVAIHAARRGLGAVVVERRADPPDKACGEGILPSGVRALEDLGVRTLLDAADCHPIDGIRYVQDDGVSAQARL